MSKYRRSPTGVGAALDLIGESLNMIGQSLKTKEYALQELNNTINDKMASISFNQSQANNLRVDGRPSLQLENDIIEDLKQVSILMQQRDDLQKDISHSQRLSEMKEENREASIYDRNKKIKSNELYDYLWGRVDEQIVELSKDTELKEIFRLLKMRDGTLIFYKQYKIDYNDFKVSVWVDYSDFSKIYLQVVRDIEKTYKGDIEIEKENERIRKLNKKIKRENRLIVAGMFGAFGKFVDKLNKKGRR